MSQEKLHIDNSRTFPILDLPRELRDTIYDLSIEPRADFFWCDRFGCRPPGFFEPRLDPVEDVQYERSLDKSDPVNYPSDLPEDEFGHEEELEHEEPFTVLSYRVSMLTPLLFVNKEISKEVQLTLQSLYKRLREVFRSTISGQRIMLPPSTEFVDICARSRFILSGTSAGVLSSIYFLYQLPSIIRSRVQHLVLMKDSFDFNSDEQGLIPWSRQRGDKDSPLLEFLPNNFPGLREIDVETTVQMGDDDHFFEFQYELCDLLFDEKIDVVRLLKPLHSGFEGEPPIWYSETLWSDLVDNFLEGLQPGFQTKSIDLSHMREWVPLQVTQALEIRRKDESEPDSPS